MDRHTAYIGLGSNLGDRENLVKNALRMLHQLAGVKVSKTSDLIEAEPLGGMDQPVYINAVAEIKTELAPEELLVKLGEVEEFLGRKRDEKWSARTIDMDLLLYGNRIIRTEKLTVPHEQMYLRSFVMGPLSQIAPTVVHPQLHTTVAELCRRLNGGDFTLDSERAQLVSIAGNIGVGKTTLAKNLAEVLGCSTRLEAYDTNPFLADVYAGKKELALDSQLYFLTSRAEQLAPETLEPGRGVVSDYIFEKEMIYARALLNEIQLELYSRLYCPVEATVARPVLVIYFKDSAENCLDRIRKRNRPYEQQIDIDFLGCLDGGYEHLFWQFNSCPVIRLDAAKFDCTDAVALAELADQIMYYTAVRQGE